MPMKTVVLLALSNVQFLRLNTMIFKIIPAELPHGFPCLKNTVNFGSVEHVYILASNGAKFYSPNKYNKWYSKTEAENKINAYINNIGSDVENIL